MIAAGNDKLFRALAESLELPLVAEDPRFRTNPDRVAHRGALDDLIAEATRGLSTADVLARLEQAGVPAAPVQNVGEVAEHPQTAALGMLQAIPHPAVPELRTVAMPVSIDGERVTHRSPPPALGADTEAVLAEAGYSTEEIAALATQGVVRLGGGAGA
jgi:formyl-CoA transferase/CoA:oxalate CoA-transferase